MENKNLPKTAMFVGSHYVGYVALKENGRYEEITEEEFIKLTANNNG